MKLPKFLLPLKMKFSLPDNQIKTIKFADAEVRKKKILRVAIVLLLGLFAGTVYVNESKNPAAHITPKNLKNATETRIADNSSSNKSKLRITMDIADKNPFWPKDMEAEMLGNIPEESYAQTEVHSGRNRPAAGLPVIPNHQPAARLPRIPSKGTLPDKPSEHRSKTVQGILMGNGSANMAIMSDGSLLSEGERYQDSRISWIGGDGIHLENGNTIKYK